MEGLTVLHYDADFDLIAEITGQPMRMDCAARDDLTLSVQRMR